MDNIIIIGAGNVATHLARALLQSNKKIIQVISKSVTSAQTLGEICNCQFTSKIHEVSDNADLYLIAVPDDSIKEIAEIFPFKNKLLAHTSGSVSMDVLKEITVNYGVFYPLQTFTKNISLEYENIPFCIEASTNENTELLIQLASGISKNIYKIDFKQRRQLHLAAVFACNFSNHMYSIAEDILSHEEIPFDILKPLIQETARKIESLSPKMAQTGPAVRNDKLTITKHLDKLKSFEDYQKIYTFMTQSIQKEQKRK
ncbi:MAG: DUF2520 domain-containing protein [Bacteroidetes bacterium]|nr:DUF2520 domain-containing protein [Bacteroidota bacterium]